METCNVATGISRAAWRSIPRNLVLRETCDKPKSGWASWRNIRTIRETSRIGLNVVRTRLRKCLQYLRNYCQLNTWIHSSTLLETLERYCPESLSRWRWTTLAAQAINPHKTISTEIISTVSARKLSGKSRVLVAHDKVYPKWWWQRTRTTVRVALARVQSCDQDWMGAQLRFFMGKRCLRSRVWWRDSRAVVSISTDTYNY